VLIHQGRVAALRDVFRTGADPNVAAAFIAVPGGTPTRQEVQKLRYHLTCGVIIYGWQDTHSQYRDGLLDEDSSIRWEGAALEQSNVTGWMGIYRVPGTQFAALALRLGEVGLQL